jgi:nucleotide-binding universal stress UspA family protein
MSSIVVGYDFSHTGHAALRRAVELAAGESSTLHVLCVLDPHDPLPSIPAEDGVDYRYVDRVMRALDVAVRDELRDTAPGADVPFHVHARIGKPAGELVTLAREVAADLVVVGSHGLTGLERLLVGSVSEKVTREANCSVEVVKGEATRGRASLQAWRSYGSPTTHRSS